MKKFGKWLLGIAGVVLFFCVVVLIVNATDEKLTAAATEGLKPPTPQPGYSLQKMRLRNEDRPTTLNITTYQDYLKDPGTFDTALTKYQKAVDPLLAAFAVGHVEVSNDTLWQEIGSIYPHSAHRLFIVLLSQKVREGKTAEALDLLEKSNQFLTSIITSPQFMLNTMIATAALSTNATFAKSLKESGKVKALPQSLKDSFVVAKSPSEIMKDVVHREQWFITTALFTEGITNSELTNLSESRAPIYSSLTDYFLRALYRPKQTANWAAVIYSDLMTSECMTSELEECSATYRAEVVEKGPKFYLMNPVGRALLAVFAPRFTGQWKKLTKKLDEIATTRAAL